MSQWLKGFTFASVACLRKISRLASCNFNYWMRYGFVYQYPVLACSLFQCQSLIFLASCWLERRLGCYSKAPCSHIVSLASSTFTLGQKKGNRKSGWKPFLFISLVEVLILLLFLHVMFIARPNAVFGAGKNLLNCYKIFCYTSYLPGHIVSTFG